MSPRLAFAIDAATKAGRQTLAHFQTGVRFETKPDASPVTIADRTAERMIREAIAREFPGDHILGEEEGGDTEVPDRWVLDPIDGTKSFVAGVPLYATLISYEKDFVPQLGVVFLAALNELIYAERGGGTFWNGRPVRVSQKTDLQRGIVCSGGHRTMLERGKTPGFERIARDAMATRTWSDAYGHILVATGRVEAMVDPLVSRWDVSAVQVVVEEAGGTFTDFSGGPALKNVDELEAISSNGLVHKKILEAFQA